MHLETIAVHSGRTVDPSTGALAPPIHLSTTFERDEDGNFSRGFDYSRQDNPNRHSLETCLAALEGGTAAVAFPSGMAAISAVIEALHLTHPGRLILPQDMYFGIRSLLTDTEFGRKLDVTFVDMTGLPAIERACAGRAIGAIWIETPSNPLVSVADIAEIVNIAKAHGAVTCVDNTWATPLLQRPLELGADVVVHSLTKYIGGHSDVMAGAVVVREDGAHLEEMRAMQRHRGILLSPFDCWMALRGVATLSARMAVHCSNAMQLARHLEGHPKISAVHYPGLPSHSGHRIAAKQMNAFGGMLSIVLRGGRKNAMAVATTLQVFTRATSLGGNHSLIEHRASIEGLSTMAPEGLLRLSIGLEHVDDLRADLDRSLNAAFQ
ncbi:MAG: Cystathionine gamma-synthase [Nitrospira sp.]|nr:MAG: Cystathionine gamma-synthase [Nitrospira sp.]